MIQRIQTLYLLLASLALFALFLFPIASVFDLDGMKKITVMGVYETVNGTVVQTDNFLLLTIATVVLAFIPLVLIFLFKNRLKQRMFIYIDVVLVIAFSYWLASVVKNASQTALQLGDYGIGIGLSSLSILFLILAARGITRDEKLVKSADRLR